MQKTIQFRNNFGITFTYVPSILGATTDFAAQSSSLGIVSSKIEHSETSSALAICLDRDWGSTATHDF